MAVEEFGLHDQYPAFTRTVDDHYYTMMYASGACDVQPVRKRKMTVRMTLIPIKRTWSLTLFLRPPLRLPPKLRDQPPHRGAFKVNMGYPLLPSTGLDTSQRRLRGS